MSNNQVKQNIKLSLEFDKYVEAHPQLLDHIPQGSSLVMTTQSDPGFSERNIAMVKGARNLKKTFEAHKSGFRWTVRSLSRV